MLNFILLFTFLLFISPLLSQDVKPTHNNPQRISVFDSEVEFSGWYGNNKNITDIDEVRIGLFFPDTSENEIDNSIKNAADLAIEEINKSGGYQGIPYRLIRRWSNDPWRAGSKEMIKLVYKDSVWAVIGSLGGDATHIAEQIATKALLPLISPVSADPTLNYIRIPWIFRLPPDYHAQAKLIVEQGVEKHSIQKIGMISSTSHDGRIFSKELRDALRMFNQSLVFHFEVSSQQLDFLDIIERAITFQPDGLIIFLPNHKIENIISILNNKSFSTPVFIPWIPGINNELFTTYENGNVFLVEPFSLSQNPAWDMFRQKYQQRFGKNPSPGAVFTYDAIYLLVHAIEKAGLNRAAIRDAIANTSYFSPVTGIISWDNTGGNIIQPVLRKIK